MHAFAAETTESTGDARSPRSGERALLILATLPALQREDGRWLLPAKLVTGVQAYVGSWPGPVILGLQPGKRPSADLDNAYWDPATLRFQVQRFDLQPFGLLSHGRDYPCGRTHPRFRRSRRG